MHIKKLVGLILASALLSACGETPTLPDPTGNTQLPITTTTSPSSAADLSPGQSLNPPDKGRTFSSDFFKYTLLDAREDQTVILIKLEVENITSQQRGLSIAEVRMKDDPNVRAGTAFGPDVLYPRSNVGIDLGTLRSLKPGEKITGYYIFKYQPYTKLYLHVLSLGSNLSGEITSIDQILSTAGTFVIKG